MNTPLPIILDGDLRGRERDLLPPTPPPLLSTFPPRSKLRRLSPLTSFPFLPPLPLLIFLLLFLRSKHRSPSLSLLPAVVLVAPAPDLEDLNMRDGLMDEMSTTLEAGLLVEVDFFVDDDDRAVVVAVDFLVEDDLADTADFFVEVVALLFFLLINLDLGCDLDLLLPLLRCC
jgi:hypothetical protein